MSYVVSVDPLFYGLAAVALFLFRAPTPADKYGHIREWAILTRAHRQHLRIQSEMIHVIATVEPALGAHLDAAHMHEHRKRVRDLATKTIIHVLRPV